MEYVEQFQQVEATMVLAKVSISDRRKTLQFVKGIKDVGDRRFILEKSPKTFKPPLGGAHKHNAHKKKS
eukprot:801773-Rhodomonas_salina.1